MADQTTLPKQTLPGKVRFTGEQVLEMQERGLLPTPNHIELIDGDLLDMGSEGDKHGYLRVRLTNAITRMTSARLTVAPEPTFRLADDVWPEPDIVVFDAKQRPSAVKGPDALLVVEVSDSTLAYDLSQKAALYARFGVREYWVIEAASGRCHMHQNPDGASWRLIRIVEPSEALEAMLVAEIKVRIADLL